VADGVTVERRRDEAVLAVDLGGTTMRAAVVDTGGRLLARRAVPTPHASRGPSALVELVTEVLERHSVDHAVFGVPGPVEYVTGCLKEAPNLPEGWVGWLTEDTLRDTLGLPVALANDADMAAVGEATFGAGRGHSDVVYLTISTGVGAGVVLNGRLVHGSRSIAEVGHTVIDRFAARAGELCTVEELSSGQALERHAAALGIDADGAALVALVRDDDGRARTVWDQAVEVAGLAVANLVHLFAPQVVVVGGGVGRSGEVLLAPIRDLLEVHGPRGARDDVAIVGATLGDDAGLIGSVGWRLARGLPRRPLTDANEGAGGLGVHRPAWTS
jgi:glucokinase